MVRNWGTTRATIAAVFVVMALPSTAAEVAKTCADFYEFTSGDVAFQNNIWQRNGVPGTQCLTDKGWQWDWPVTEKREARSYPAVYFGQRPWSQKSTTPELPIRVSELRSLVVDYEISTTETGVNNTSFDVWVTASRNSTDGSDRTAELMIWLRHSPELAPGTGIADRVTVGNEDYDLYLTANGPITNANFVASEYRPKGMIDIAQFLAALPSGSQVDPNQFLRSVELGNQINSGTGETVILNMTVRVNK